MADVVLDANVVVAYLDANDSLHHRAGQLLGSLEAEGLSPVLLDICVGEAISVLCRRARERRGSPGTPGPAKLAPDLHAAIERVRQWTVDGDIVWVGAHAEQRAAEILDVVEATRGRLNYNDALLVVLQRASIIGDVASFDDGFDVVPSFRRLS
jgi:predicted nucleic acid-binding protein